MYPGLAEIMLGEFEYVLVTAAQGSATRPMVRRSEKRLRGRKDANAPLARLIQRSIDLKRNVY